jgi:dephospho-CoA kinase
MRTEERTRTQPYYVGLTGNIATGKSTVLNYLATKGAHVVDADKLAHRAMAPDGPAYDKVVAAFGRSILDEDGEVNRPKLGEIVFGDPDALTQLETIVHPATFELLRWDVAQSDAEIVILEAIKLLESGRMLTLCDEVWVVTSHPDAQLRRMIEQRGMSEEAARQRMAAQSHQAKKVAQADHVILNDGTLEELHAQLDVLWDAMLARARSKNAAWT